MARRRQRPDPSLTEIRRAVAARLANRADQLEQTILTRVQAISSPSVPTDPEYRQGLRSAVRAGVEFAISVTERDEDRVPLPLPLLAQARLAARHSVGLRTVMLRCVGGGHLLADATRQAATNAAIDPSHEHLILRSQTAGFDRVLAAIADEYEREEQALILRPRDRLVTRIERLLDGEALSTAEIEYDFSGHHLAIIATSGEVEALVNHLASRLGGRSLVVSPTSSDQLWAWIGFRGDVAPEDLDRELDGAPLPSNTVCVGELSRGLEGWRLSHRQARAILPQARQADCGVCRYAPHAVAAGIEGDALLHASLQEIYLAPLANAAAEDRVLVDTLRAYFAASRNRASAAAALGVSRQTVGNRLRAAEAHLGRRLDGCAADLEIALRLLDSSSSSVDTGHR